MEDREIRKTLFVPDALLPDLSKAFSPMLEWAKSVDATMVPAVQAEMHRMEKLALHLQKRIQKAAERKEIQQIEGMRGLIASLFPNQALQERTESWLSFLVTDPDWLKKIEAAIDPLDFRFQVLVEKT